MTRHMEKAGEERQRGDQADGTGRRGGSTGSQAVSQAVSQAGGRRRWKRQVEQAGEEGQVVTRHGGISVVIQQYKSHWGLCIPGTLAMPKTLMMMTTLLHWPLGGLVLQCSWHVRQSYLPSLPSHIPIDLPVLP